jgi:hypothetical protein
VPPFSGFYLDMFTDLFTYCPYHEEASGGLKALLCTKTAKLLSQVLVGMLSSLQVTRLHRPVVTYSVGVPEPADRGTTISHTNVTRRCDGPGAMTTHVNDVFCASACVLNRALQGALDCNCCMVLRLGD